MPRTLTYVDRTLVTAGLERVWSTLDDLLSPLEAADWAGPSPLPGWDVKAIVAHVVGTESMLLGLEPTVPAVPETEWPPHVHNDIGAFNERWIEQYRATPPDELLEVFRSVTDRRGRALEAMTDEEWNAQSFTPAGLDTYGRFMRIRIFDCWTHDQDIRDAVGRAGNTSGPDVDLALQEMASAMPYVVGKLAGAPAGSDVTIRLTGDEARDFNVHVADRAALVDELPDPPDVVVSMPVATFVRLAGGRITPEQAYDSVALEGDETLGRRIVDHFNYTI